MAIPNELQQAFSNEEAFCSGFLIPLLHRLGYSLVVNYHGGREFGRDLVFGEIDRFGHIVYHGLQAKYVKSISLRDSEDLVLDAKQAFANPFRHPQKASDERISTFFAVNGGSISDEAHDHYYNSLRNPFGANVRLLSGKDLLALDKLAAFNRNEWIGERISGIILEAQYNKAVAGNLVVMLDAHVHNKGPFPIDRLRTMAVSSYLERPFLLEKDLYQFIHEYWRSVTGMNEIAMSMDGSLFALGFKEGRLEGIKQFRDRMVIEGNEIERQLSNVLGTLKPIAGL